MFLWKSLNLMQLPFLSLQCSNIAIGILSLVYYSISNEMYFVYSKHSTL